MPPKNHKRLQNKSKSQIQFIEPPKEIPHGLLTPIHCSNYQAGARLTEIDNNMLWVSPQFTGIKDLPTKKLPNKKLRKKNPKPTTSSENACSKEPNRYESLQFVKPKSCVAFQNCQSLSNIENAVISQNFRTPKETYPWYLFLNSPKKKDCGKILVPDTPECDYGLSVRQKQLKYKRN